MALDRIPEVGTWWEATGVPEPCIVRIAYTIAGGVMWVRVRRYLDSRAGREGGPLSGGRGLVPYWSDLNPMRFPCT